MSNKIKYVVSSVAAVAIAAIAALYPNSSAFCRRAVECGAVPDYDSCVACSNPEREHVATALLNAHGGIQRDMSEISCVTVLWTAANYQITTCSKDGKH